MQAHHARIVWGIAWVLGCGGDDGPTTDAGETSAGSQSSTPTTDSSGTASSGTANSTDTGGSSSADSSDSTGGQDIPCGDAMTCTGGDVCIEDAIEPACTNLEDPNGMCPPGQSMTFCGGAGIPCCCEPPPPSEYRCVAPVDCTGAVDCQCLGKVCTEGRECIALGADPEHLFRCEEPPAP